jgi:hypothetical protein
MPVDFTRYLGEGLIGAIGSEERDVAMSNVLILYAAEDGTSFLPN